MKQASLLLVCGLVCSVIASAELKLDGVSPAELKEIEKEIANGNVPPNYTPSDKLRRGAVKLTNADNPSFNYLTTPTTTKTTTASVPVRYVYNNQQPYPYYQPQTSYLPLVQPGAHAAQIAAQYYNPSVTHFLQTPTQIQYVSTPGQTKYQTINTKSSTTGASSAAATTSAVTQTAHQQYLTPQFLAPQYTIQQQYYIPQQTAAASATASQATTAAGGAVANAAHTMRMYPQQPVVMLLLNPSPYMYVPQHTAAQQQYSYLFGQHPFLNYYGQQRFTYPFAQPQMTYLVPMSVGASGQQAAATGTTGASAIDASGAIQQDSQAKASTTPEQTQQSPTYGVRTKS